MNRRFAFFDLDGTIITIKSMFDFFPFWCASMNTPYQAEKLEVAFLQTLATATSREDLNRAYYRLFRGALPADLYSVGKEWFIQRFWQGHSLYNKSIVARLKEHQSDGVHPVFVSGSMSPLIKPIADDLGVEYCLCTRLLVDLRGLLTGEIGTPQTIGLGKAIAIAAFLQAQSALAVECFAYGDDRSDVPMLKTIGTPVAVGSAPDLIEVATQRSWSLMPV